MHTGYAILKNWLRKGVYQMPGAAFILIADRVAMSH